MDSLIFSSVENIPSVNARAAFTVNSAAVFREDCDVMPSTFGNIKYMPWGADNQMPYDIIDLIERDETLATCQIFNAEICYGSGLVYDTCVASEAVNKPKGRFFWFVEGWGCFIYLASGNQKNRPFGYVFTFLLARKRCIFGEKGVCLEKKVYFCRLIIVQNRENGLSHHYTHCRQYGHYAS